MKFSGILSLAFILLCFICVSSAIDEDSAKESRCFSIINAIDPDASWFSSVKKWYYPLASRLDLYRSVNDLLETDYKNIPEYSVYYDSCLEWTIDSQGYTLAGFNGRKRRLNATPVGQGTSDFHSEWPQGMSGRAYTTLTNNKTFAFTAACFSDNQMSWNVFSTTPYLDDATKQEILEHAKSLGYNPKYFTEMRYDSCRRSTTHNSGFTSNNVINATPLSSNNNNNGPSFICNACKKICPNVSTKYPYMYKPQERYTNMYKYY